MKRKQRIRQTIIIQSSLFVPCPFSTWAKKCFHNFYFSVDQINLRKFIRPPLTPLGYTFIQIDQISICSSHIVRVFHFLTDMSCYQSRNFLVLILNRCDFLASIFRQNFLFCLWYSETPFLEKRLCWFVVSSSVMEGKCPKFTAVQQDYFFYVPCPL